MKAVLLLVVVGFVVFFSGSILVAESAFNKEINYQGKLTDELGVTVADGTYNIAFNIYTSETGSTPIWSSTTTVPVLSGLFSHMLGSTTDISGVDFDQTLYLGVNIGGTGAASWDGEMAPRKRLGAVPAAFEAQNAQTFAGIATTSFLRSDQADEISATTASTLLTITQSGAGDILNLFDGGTEIFTVLDGGNVGIGTTSPGIDLDIYGSTAPGFRIGSATGYTTYGLATGNAQYSNIATPDDAILRADTEDLILTARNASGNIYLSTGAVDTAKVTVLNNGNVGIGTTSPSAALEISRDSQNFTALKLTRSGTAPGSLTFNVSTAGASSIIGDYTTTIRSGNATNLQFGDGSDTNMIINGIGHVGIGTTTTSLPARLTVRTTGTTDVLNLFEAGGSEVFTVLESGFVGIGKTAPTVAFEVDTSGADMAIFSRSGTARVTLEATGSNGSVGLKGSLGNEFVIGGNGNDFHIWDGAYMGDGTNRFTILQNGNVGIGDTSPAYLLTVGNGDLFGVNSSGMIATQSVSTTSLMAGGTLTDGYILAASSTAAGGFAWYATSSLGLPTSDTVITVAANDTSATLKANADFIADGTADNVEIQAAIDAVYTNGGGMVELLAGTFDIAASVVVSTSTHLMGAGASSTHLIPSTSGIDMLQVNSDHVVISGLHFKNTTFTSGVNIAVDINANATHVLIARNIFEGVETELHIRGGDYTTVSHNTFTGTGAEILTDQADHIIVSNNTFDGVALAIYTYLSDYSTYTNNTFQNVGIGMSVDTAHNQSITGNTFDTASQYFIYLGSRDSVVSSNTFGASTDEAILVDLSRNTISNNTFDGSGAGLSGSEGIIHVTGDDNLIAGNRFNNTSGSRVAIEIDALKTDNQVTNNYITGSGISTLVSDSGTGTRYDEHDRRTLTTSDSVGYDLFYIQGSSTASAFSVTQLGTGDIANFLDSSSNAVLTIDANGNVGIGTTTPNAKLTLSQSVDSIGLMIAGYDNESDEVGHLFIDASGIFNIDVSGPTGAGYLSAGGTAVAAWTSARFIMADDKELSFGDGNDYSWGYNSTDDTIRLVDGNDASSDANTRMMINSAGYIGIGTTTPQTILTIQQPADDNGIRLYGFDDKATSYGEINIDTNGYLTLAATGLGGRLSDDGTIVADWNSNNFNIFDNKELAFGNDNDFSIGFNATGDDTLRFVTGSAVSNDANTKMLINASGDIGIGTTTPLAKLAVAGNGMFGTGLIPSTANASNTLSLLIGANANGATNGITFAELNNGYGMKLGYDGTGSGDANALRIYNSNDSSLFTFQNGGAMGIGTDDFSEFTSSISDIGIFDADSSGQARIDLRSSDVEALLSVRSDGSNDTVQFGSVSSHPVSFYANNGRKMLLDTSGGLRLSDSIGDFGSADYSIDLEGDNRVIAFQGTTINPASLSGLLFSESTNSMGLYYDGSGSGDSNKIVIRDHANSDTDRFAFMRGGSFGIGDVSPEFGLELVATSTSGYFGISSTSGADGDIFSILENGRVGIGTTSPDSILAIDNTGLTGSVTGGINQYIGLANATNGAVQYGDRSFIAIDSTATSTVVGGIIRVKDNTVLGNTIRGFEVQADKGSNTLGENTALSGFARTFGVRGYTSGEAGGTYQPAGGFFETGGDTQGNAIRGFSSSITTASLLSLYQESSAFAGTGLKMNFGNSSGSFASTTASKFVDLQNAGTSKFMVYHDGRASIIGTTTIGTGDTSQKASLHVGYGAICVDNDGSCTEGTLGRITSVSQATANSDLAEMYFSNEDLEPGELVVSDGFISIERADGKNGTVLGVVSTKPGLLMGSDDTPLSPGTGYPLALAGRVPVKLSTENGFIKTGDPLMLSSIPGVAMKAAEGAEIVGYALENFKGERAYTEGFINQFGDDIAKPNYEAAEALKSKQEKAGCYYGGGGTVDATSTKACDPNDVMGELATSGPTDEEIAQARYEAEQEAIDALRYESARSQIVAGETVSVGTVIMFVDRGLYLSSRQINVLNELTSTSTEIVLGAKKGSGETLWDRLKVLAQNFVDGVLRVAGLKTSKICLEDNDGETCIDRQDLNALINNASAPRESGYSGNYTEATSDDQPKETDPSDTPDTTSGPDHDPTASSTEPTLETETATSAEQTENVAAPENGAPVTPSNDLAPDTSDTQGEDTPAGEITVEERLPLGAVAENSDTVDSADDPVEEVPDYNTEPIEEPPVI